MNEQPHSRRSRAGTSQQQQRRVSASTTPIAATFPYVGAGSPHAPGAASSPSASGYNGYPTTAQASFDTAHAYVSAGRNEVYAPPPNGQGAYSPPGADHEYGGTNGQQPYGASSPGVVTGFAPPQHQDSGAYGNPENANTGQYGPPSGVNYGPLTPRIDPHIQTFKTTSYSYATPTGDQSTEYQENPSGTQSAGHGGIEMYRVPNPPHLDTWRQRLFDIDGTFVLTEEQFKTYFPHVDNVYSHRSTQKYKRKPFVSHYWDCRLKGRPPGTPKSDDPNKKKRKRHARDRDLCDVKIKITEYFPGAFATMNQTGERPNDGLREMPFIFAPDGSPVAAAERTAGHAQLLSISANRFYTLTRVSGGGTGNVEEDTQPGGHRHTLAESDRIKKSSIQRELLKAEKEQKKAQREQKTYHKKATGLALATAKKHSRDHELKLYGSCFCPFVQRVWIAMELKGLQYQYIEIDPYKKPASLLALNPLGLVPALQHASFATHESMVVLEYLEDSFAEQPLLGTSPQQRARARLWADHVSKKIIPPFYRLLQAQDTAKQAANAQDLKQGIETLVAAARPEGPFFDGPAMGYVDVVLAPWMLRLSRVLGPYRAWPAADPDSRWAQWIQAVESNEAVKATTSGDELYLDSYERYADNRPNTSQLAEAINSGRPIP